MSLGNLPQRKCNQQWHIQSQRDWVLCPSETSPENAWNVFRDVIDHGMSNSRAVGEIGFRVPRKPPPKMHGMCSGMYLTMARQISGQSEGLDFCVPHWCPSETYHENAWNAFENVIGHGTSNFRVIRGIGFRVPRKPTPKMHGMCLKM